MTARVDVCIPLVTDARHAAWSRAQMLAATLARVIIHAGGSRRLATHAQDREGDGMAIVFNHPCGEICLENHLGVMDGARALLRASLSGSSDTVFHEPILSDEISGL